MKVLFHSLDIKALTSSKARIALYAQVIISFFGLSKQKTNSGPLLLKQPSTTV